MDVFPSSMAPHIPRYKLSEFVSMCNVCTLDSGYMANPLALEPITMRILYAKFSALRVFWDGKVWLLVHHPCAKTHKQYPTPAFMRANITKNIPHTLRSSKSNCMRAIIHSNVPKHLWRCGGAGYRVKEWHNSTASTMPCVWYLDLTR